MTNSPSMHDEFVISVIHAVNFVKWGVSLAGGKFNIPLDRRRLVL